ncbi:MAG: hypothetical protein IIA67_04935 [Planctomycetes bacterium]|nr:hypothetical protein [Planctomycetota bacterium]
MRQKTMRLIFWGALAVVSSSLLVVAGVWVGEKTGDDGRRTADQGETEPDPDFENRLLGILSTEIKDDGDIDKEQRDEALAILRKADPELSRIKRENREAMRRANRHPRIVRPKKAAPAPKKEDQSKDSREPTKHPKSDAAGDSDQPSKGEPQ